MCRYSKAVNADVSGRISPPHWQSAARISEELSIREITLYKCTKTSGLEGEAVPASQMDPDGWSTSDKFPLVLESAGLNATELSSYCRERGPFSEQMWRLPQGVQHAIAMPVLTMSEPKELEKLRAQDQQEIKALKNDLQCK